MRVLQGHTTRSPIHFNKFDRSDPGIYCTVRLRLQKHMVCFVLSNRVQESLLGFNQNYRAPLLIDLFADFCTICSKDITIRC